MENNVLLISMHININNRISERSQILTTRYMDTDGYSIEQIV